MSVHRLVAVLALLTVVGASGCLFSREQVNVTQFGPKVSGIVPGQSTVADLEALVGPPTSITPIGEKRLLVYAFSDSKTVGFNFVLIGVAKTNAGFDTALFLVNQQDVIEDVSITRNSADLPWQFWAFGD